MLSNKQIQQIKKEYPKKSVEQIADELHLSESQIYTALGLKKELWTFWLENTVGYLVVVLLLIAPLVFIRGLHDFADLPQRVFIQCLAVILVLLSSVRIIIKGEFAFPRSPLYLIIAAFITWPFITLFWANSIFEGFYSAIHIAACGAVFFSLSTIPYSMKWINRMLSAIIIAGTGVAIIGLAQHFFQLRWVPMSLSPAATFGNPNMAADYLTMVLPLMIAMSFKQKAIVRYVRLISVLLVTVFLFYARSRGAWLAVVCALIYMTFLYVKRDYKINMRLVWAVPTLLLIICIVIISLAPGLRYKLEDTALSEYRLVAWRNSLEMIKEKPLLGFGAGNFKIIYPAYSHKAVPDMALDTTKSLGKAHNDYIQTAVELGITGMLLFVLLPIFGLIIAYRIISNSKNYPMGFITVGIAGGIISFMVGSFFSFYMERANPPLLLLTYLSMLAILYSTYFPVKNMAKIRVPNTVGILFICCLLIAGVSLVRFNFKNIMCERYYFIAMGMEKQGSQKSALSAGLQAHGYNKYRMDVLTTAGRAYAATGEPEKAIAALEKVTQTHPFDLNALFILGIAYANNDMNEKALAVFRTVLELNPDSPEAKKIVCLLNSRKTVRINLT